MPILISSIFFTGFVLGASALFANLEVQIEGPHGWAGKLPTWRMKNRWTRLFLDAKPLTGYHLYALLFLFCFAHLPYVVDLTPFSWAIELRILAFLVLFWVVEDFFWFVLNPAFGLARFRSECIWWHRPAWWWFMPRGYWIGIPVGIALYWFSWIL